MTNNSQKNSNIIGTRQRIAVYASNPSIPENVGRYKKIKTKEVEEGLIISADTGEIIGQRDAVFYKITQVDTESFVKIYLEGLKRAIGFSKAAMTVFEIVYNLTLKNPNQDQIILNFFTASGYVPDLNQRTYNRGLRELLEKEFLFHTASEGVFFVNIGYMFNGDRLAFVKGYQRKK